MDVTRTQVFVNEAVLVQHGNRIGDALRDHGNASEDARRHFWLHAVLDVEQCASGLNRLSKRATTKRQKRVCSRRRGWLERFAAWARDLYDA
jgi:hypothetical protein